MSFESKKTRRNRWVRRNYRRQDLTDKYFQKRTEYKKELVAAAGDIEKQFEIMKKLEKLPRDSSYIRQRNRCPFNGRPRGTYRKVGVCRALFRNWVMEGYLPGFVMASW